MKTKKQYNCYNCGIKITSENANGIRPNGEYHSECKHCGRDRMFIFRWNKKSNDEIIKRINSYKHKINLLDKIVHSKNE